MRSPLALLLFLLTLGLVPATAQDGFRPLFNGKDLTGWDGNPDLWTVEDGAITGRTKGPDHLAYNQFLIWRGGELRNFELRAKIKQSGNNSGIQYRSKEFPEVGKWSVGGYQCDIHPNAGYNGMVYEERARGIVVQNGQGVIVDDKGAKWLVSEHEPVKVDVAEWHEYTVIAQGNHLIHKIDGKVTIDLVDHDAKARALSGLLAFQVHRGPAMVVQIKDVMLKELPEGGLLSPETNPIPSDAHRIEAPGAKAAPKAAAAPKAKGKAPEKAKAPAAKAGPKKDPNAGLAIGENKATPVERIKVPKGFKVELLYSVPGSEQGSWVALCHDDKGRIYASDQYGALYRFPAPAAGQPLDPATIQKMPVEVRAINGMVWAFGALYAGVNDYEQKIPSGLYRLSSTKGDDLIDKAELLNEFKAGSDHGVHAVLPTPDGKSLFLVCGNNAVYHGSEKSSPVPRTWGDDHLLPRMPDGRGHNRHVLAPGGIIYRVSPDGKKLEVYASGFRNIYDASLNRDGELFTYDADMEYDFNTSWYRPTRINHVVSGAEYGWRNGAGKYPEFYADNLPATLNIGPGSPTGTTFGYGAKFPLKYRESFFALDWSWGKIYAVHLQPDGASYKATKEEFVSGAPLPVTDAIILPQDGAMYFAIGGRKVQSGLYRVTYPGFDKLQEPQIAAAVLPPEAQLRRQLEAFHGRQDPAAVAFAWPHLGHADRFVRWAARIVLEHQPVAGWQARALAETNPTAQLEAFFALAHVTSTCPSHRTPESPNLTAPRDAMLAALLKYDWSRLSEEQRLAYVRLIEVILHRSAEPVPAETLAALVAKLDPVFPAASFELNWELIETLVFLQAPNTAAKGMALVAAAPSQEPQIEYMRSLRMLRAGWTPELRAAQLEWFLKAANYRGGSSFVKFIEFIRNDSLATFTDAEKQRHAELIARKPVVKSAIENVGAMFAGRTPRNWTLEELTEATRTGLKNRDFENGRRMFGAAACFACHRFGNAGGMTGPDLTQAGGRYSPHDFLDQILNPSKEINEQFAPIIVTKNNGDILSGVVVNLNGDRVTLNTDLSDPDQRVDIDRKEVKSIELSKVSPMPPMLLSMLTQEEILDLVAFVLSGGDKENAMFRK